MSTMKPRPSKGSKGRRGSASASEVQAFPEAAASDLIRMARYVFKATEVKGQIEVARKLKPNGNAILDVAEKWYSASDRFKEAVQKLDASYTGLDVYWNGDAFDAFSGAMGKVSPVIDGDGDRLFEIGNAIIDLYNIATEGYNEAVKDISDTLQEVTPMDPDKDKEELLSALLDFIAKINNRRTTLRKNLSARQAQMARLRGLVSQVHAPMDVPDGITDKRKWTFDPN